MMCVRAACAAQKALPTVTPKRKRDGRVRRPKVASGERGAKWWEDIIMKDEGGATNARHLS